MTATGPYEPIFNSLVIGDVSEYMKGDAIIKKMIADSKLYKILGSIICFMYILFLSIIFLSIFLSISLFLFFC